MNSDNLKNGVKTQFKSGDHAAENGRKGGLKAQANRKRRKETLETLSNNIAGKVKRTHRAVVLEPMNPYERRIIHACLQGNKFVDTYSEGEEPYRRVVVTPKRNH